MSDRIFGKTGIEISKAILGCGTFGGIGGARDLIGHGLDRDGAYRTLNEAVSLGINVLDTAERYADGESERTIGEWLRSSPDDVRSSVHIATKVAPPLAEGLEGIPFDRGFIEHKLEISLERLGVDRVAFYLSHAPDDETPVEQTIEGFAAVIESGQVEHIGCCNVNARQLVEYLDTAERLGVPGFEWVQNGFSLLTPTADRELRAVCKERGLGYTPFSPLAGGVLTGKYKRGEPFPEGTRMALRPEGHADLLTESVYDALEKLAEVAAQHNVSVASLALAWVMGHPDCTAPVVGPSRTAPHLPHIADAMALKLTVGEHAQLTAWFEEATNPA